MTDTKVPRILKPTTLAVASLRIRNFKAIRDSGNVRLTPLSVLIGNNGAGKSSLIEAMETLKAVASDGLDAAMQQWSGFEYAWNRSVPHALRQSPDGKSHQTNPMTFKINGATREGTGQNTNVCAFHGTSEITAGPGTNEVFFLREELTRARKGEPIRRLVRSDGGDLYDTTGQRTIRERLSPDRSVLYAEPSLRFWQFLRLNPEAMARPKLLRRVGGYRPLAPDGSNIAEYLLDILSRDASVIHDIIEAIQAIVPYIQDVQPTVTSEIGRSAHLKFREREFELPGWLLSTGTLRLVALLAVLRHPDPPPLIVIEELENGLDPRTIGLIVEEIRDVVSRGKSQVILTTHSPYLLDLLPLASMIFVERVNGQPTFSRPNDVKSVQRWSQEFAPGRLYAMGRFRTGQ